MNNNEISRLVAENKPLPSSLTSTGELYLRGYDHPLPSSITSTGDLYLSGYDHLFRAASPAQATST